MMCVEENEAYPESALFEHDNRRRIEIPQCIHIFKVQNVDFKLASPFSV